MICIHIKNQSVITFWCSSNGAKTNSIIKIKNLPLQKCEKYSGEIRDESLQAGNSY